MDIPTVYGRVRIQIDQRSWIEVNAEVAGAITHRWDAGKIVWSSDLRVPPNGLLTIAPLPSSARLGRY